MKNTPIHIRVGQPSIGELERRYVTDAITRGELGHFGSYVQRFEESFSEYCSSRFGVATSSGTAALHVALTSLRLGPGDEVILPTLAMIACINVITYTGARPVLVDADEETWTMDATQLRDAISDRTRAIMPVHLYGHPTDMNEIEALAREHNFYVVEDAAEAHGAEYRGRRVGSLGKIAAFSFYLNKVLTTGEGGMVITSDQEIAERARRLSDQAFEPQRFVHRELGYNYRMTNLQAAVGCAQVERADELVTRKREIASLYRRLLAEVPGLTLPPEAPWARSVFWMVGLVVEDEFGPTRDQLQRYLLSHGVETRTFFHPLHRQPLYAEMFLGRRFPVAERLAERGFYVPSGASLTDEEVGYVATCVRNARKEAIR
jgi:perosamine synthetase